MEKGLYIDELVPGTGFSDGLFQVRGVTPRPEGTNRPKITLELADRTGTCKAKSWDVDDAVLTQLLNGTVTYVSVSGIVEAGGYYIGEVNMTGLKPAPVPDDILPFLPDLRPHHGRDKNRFFALVKSIGFAPLRELLQVLFKPHAAAFYEAYAAERRHHAYRGGLLRHTVEVAEMCQNACGIFPELRHDLVVCGALLHDFGKLHELDAFGNLTDTGVLVGHIGEGMYQIRRAAEGVTDLPLSLTQELTHLVLSHHGRKEYGSPQTPATLEAQVLTHCDQLSASVTHHLESQEQLHKTGARFARKGTDVVWTGDPQTAHIDLSGKKVDLVRYMQEDPFEESPALSPITVRLPLLGWVAAGDGDQGSYLNHPENAEDWREVVPPPGGADFLLRVTGDSMVGAGIVEGDLLFVKRTEETPRPGQIVIASVPDGLGGVVKRFAVDATGIPTLVSENSDYAPISVTENVRVQGRVVHLLRDYG